jgi:hypothetical protein
VEAEVRHRRDRDAVDSEVEREDGEDLVAVDRLAPLVDRQHPVSVPVEGDPEVEAASADDVRQRTEVGGPATDVDVRPVGLVADRGDVRAELLEGLRRKSRVGAVRAVDRDPEARQVRAETLENVLEIAVRRDLDADDLAAPRGGAVEERLDLLLGSVRQLAAVAVEELDAVVLGRVVLGRDDRGEIEAEQRDRGRRQDAGKNGGAARGDDPAGESFLELRPAPPRVPPHEDASPAAPDGCGLPEALDEIGRERLADDAANAVGSEVLPRHGAGR